MIVQVINKAEAVAKKKLFPFIAIIAHMNVKLSIISETY